MFRLLLIVVAAFLATSQPTNEGPRRIRGAPFADQASPATKQISDLVRARFELGAHAVECGRTDNLYGYKLLLSKLPDDQRPFVEAAARRGTQQGVAAGTATACATTLRDLHSLDDRLVVLSEKVAETQAAF